MLRYVSEEAWPTNWKTLMKNFMEGYPLSALHHDTLHKPNPTRLYRHFPLGEAYFGYNAGITPGLPRLCGRLREELRGSAAADAQR